MLTDCLDCLDKPSNNSRGKEMAEDFYASSLGYVADQFQTHTVDITQRLQQLDHSSDDFVSICQIC